MVGHPVMTRKKKIGLFVGGAFFALAGLVFLAYYNLTHLQLFNFTPEQITDMGTAFKGAVGEALFNGGKQPQQSVAGGDKSRGLIEAYQKDPQKFKRYADMLDTANNAKQVGDFLLHQSGSHLPRTSEPLAIEAKLKVDAWGNPFCIVPLLAPGRVAVVSGGPSRLSCDALPLAPEDIAKSKRTIYAGPSNVIVVIAPPSQPLRN